MSAPEAEDGVTLEPGMEVFGADGYKIGEILEIFAEHVVVEKGFLFPKDYAIPVTAIRGVDPDGKVALTLTKEEALTQGWEIEHDAVDASDESV